MGDKKRKEMGHGSEQPKKKSKRSKEADTGSNDVQQSSTDNYQSPMVESSSKVLKVSNAKVPSSTKSRKRAADFLSDDEQETVPVQKSKPTTNSTVAGLKKKQKKHKKSKTEESSGETLTADGVNGVRENKNSANLEVATARKSTASSMQAEADRTQDDELAEEFGAAVPSSDEDGIDDQGAPLLAGFDSDASDRDDEEGVDTSKVPALPDYKKTQKKLRKAKEKAGADDEPGTIYVGRIPHGFYEQQMRAYFTQFGEISRLRLSRNKRTGASKHFAFIEFKSKEVAKIAAQAMDNYLMFGHILKCKFAPDENLHPDTWKGANKKYRKIPHEKLERQQLEQPKTVEQWRKKNDREQKKRDQKAAKLKEQMGLEMTPVTLKDPASALEDKQLLPKEEEPKKLTNGEAQQATSITAEAPGTVSTGNAFVEQALVLGKEESESESESESEAVEAAEDDGIAPDTESASATAVSTSSKTPATKEKKPSPFRTPSGKYIPPLQRKQLARAIHAREHPEEQKTKKKVQMSEKKLKRAAKKERRKEKMIAKFGAKNVKGGENYGKGKERRKEKRKAEREAKKAAKA